MTSELVEYAPGTDFPGVLGRTVDDSKEAWPIPERAPTEAPNVLFYVLDDTGFGQLSPNAIAALVDNPHTTPSISDPTHWV